MPCKRELIVIALFLVSIASLSSSAVAEPVNAYMITATANINGSISPAGQISVAAGGSQTLAISPDRGYQIQSVIIDGSNKGALTTYTFTNVTASHTIAAYFKLITHTITASAEANGAISPPGVNTVHLKGSMTFTITADAGYHVADVLVDGVSRGAVTSYIFNNVTASHRISATFAENAWFIIDASAGANGSISMAGRGSVLGGTNQRYTINPASGYRIADVIVDGVSQGGVKSYTFYDIRAPHVISATFTLDVYTIIATMTNYDSRTPTKGRIMPSGFLTVASGASQTFTISPDPDYVVYSVLVDGNQHGGKATYVFKNIQADHTIAAYVRPITYTIAASAGAGGSIDPPGVTTVNRGGSQTYTILPSDGYSIADVTVGHTGGTAETKGSVSSYRISDIITNMTIAATFRSNPPYTITASAGTHGSISPSGSVSVPGGANQKFTITPDPGYRLDELYIDGTKKIYPRNPYSFFSVQRNHTIHVTFVPDV